MNVYCKNINIQSKSFSINVNINDDDETIDAKMRLLREEINQFQYNSPFFDFHSEY